MNTQTVDEKLREKAFQQCMTDVDAVMAPLRALVGSALGNGWPVAKCFDKDNNEHDIALHQHNQEALQRAIVASLREKYEQAAVDKFLADFDRLQQECEELWSRVGE